MNLRIIAGSAKVLLVKRLMGPFRKRQRWLHETQWLCESEMKALQLVLLKKLIHHCYNTIPYYKALMDERHIRIDDIKTLEDIQLFPILTKKDVLNAGDRLFSRKYPKWLTRIAYTGGTTGTPMSLRRDLFSIGNEHAFVRRQFEWAGVGLCDRMAYLKGAIVANTRREAERLYAYDPIMKELLLSTYHLSTETAKEYIHLLNRYHVKALVGYPSSVYVVARACLDFGLKCKLQSVLMTSESLIASYRETISEAFGCKVFDFYGGAERVCYIHMCEQGSYHIVPEYGLTELIPVQDGDEQSKIISTGFWNMAMPLIRYDTGDLAIKTDQLCSCGRAFPVIQSILGRQGDVIRTPSGRQLGASIVTHLVYVVSKAKDFVESRIVQDALNHITIEYVPNQNFNTENRIAFEKRLAVNLPNDLNFDLKRVESVERTQSGKIRPIVSKITP